MGLAASRQEAFWEACGFGHVDRVRKFLQDGDIDVNWVSYTHDCCPIHVASQGKPEIVKMLLDAKCNVNVTDIRGNLPLHHAAMKGHHDIIQMLIDAGSEVNVQDKNGWTALHCAAYWNHQKSVKVLLKNNADATLQNKDERTPLHETARSPEKEDFKLGEIARCLIEAGSDVNAKSSDLGEADFTGLMFASYHNHPEVASAFIEAGCEINAYGTNRWTALHWAADRGNDELVFLLLEAGADPTIKGWRHERAVDRAQNPEIKEILMNAINMFEELSLLDRVMPSPTEQKSELLSPNESLERGTREIQVNIDSRAVPLSTTQNDKVEKDSVNGNRTNENKHLQDSDSESNKLMDDKSCNEKSADSVECNTVQQDLSSIEQQDMSSIEQQDMSSVEEDLSSAEEKSIKEAKVDESSFNEEAYLSKDCQENVTVVGSIETESAKENADRENSASES